ncbi:MAG: DNA-protecting protein DprA [Pseudomonadota bacterium]
MSIAFLNLVTAMLHVGSQRLGRWIPPPDPAGFAGLLDPALDLPVVAKDGEFSWWDTNESFWQEATHVLVPGLPEVFPRPLAVDLSGLAEACHLFFQEVRDSGFSYLPFWDATYPQLLREIPDPPLGLVVGGDAMVLREAAVSVVGSRCAANWALEWAAEFGALAARAGLGVVSGGAYGCDTAVHSGMLSARFDRVPAIAVQAGGIANPYPRANGRIFADIAASGGCLVSERAVHAPCRPHDFLVRNRIVSGLSMVSVIVQAAERSGAMVTARLAASQGRDVWVVQPPCADVRAAGNAILMADGATVLSDPGAAIEFLLAGSAGAGNGSQSGGSTV